MIYSTRRRLSPGRSPERRSPGEPRVARILLADDDDDARHAVAAVLRDAGYDVVEAGSGAELLDVLGASLMFGGTSARPDLVLSDILMPGFTGPEVLAALREADSRMPIILMTGLDGPSVAEDAARVGATAVFQKPFDIDEILDTMRAVLTEVYDPDTDDAPGPPSAAHGAKH